MNITRLPLAGLEPSHDSGAGVQAEMTKCAAFFGWGSGLSRDRARQLTRKALSARKSPVPVTSAKSPHDANRKCDLRASPRGGGSSNSRATGLGVIGTKTCAGGARKE